MKLIDLMPPLNPGRDRRARNGKRCAILVAIETTPREGGWGGLQWHEGNERDAVTGRCEGCGRMVRAIDLRLRQDRDGEDIWKCIDCTHEAPNKARTVKTSKGW